MQSSSRQNVPANAPNPMHLTFKNPNFPVNFINADNVLDYFSNPSNVFYDMKSCNQQVRMQSLLMPLRECLLEMPGIQYDLHFARPPLYVIMKLRRTVGPQASVTPLAYYYVINGTVYQAPDTHSLVQSRLLAAIHPLKSAFDQMSKFLRYNVAKGYSWDFSTRPANNETEDDESEEEEDEEETQRKKESADAAAITRSTTYHSTRAQGILSCLLSQFPPPDRKVLFPNATPPPELPPSDDPQPPQKKAK